MNSEISQWNKSAPVGTVNRAVHGIICYDFPTKKWLQNECCKMMNNDKKKKRIS
jgi:hypothetical protein